VTRPRVLSLDAADTLFTERRSRAALYAEVFAEAGVNVDEPVMAQAMSEEHDAVRVDGPAYSERWFEAFVGALLRRHGSALPAEPLRRQLAARFLDPATYRVYAEVPAALERLTASGQRLVLVSNWSDRLPQLLADLGLAAPFEQLYVSQIEGLAKPDPELFRRVAARQGIAPDALLHVGNNRRNDVDAPRAAGCDAWWLDRSVSARGDDIVHSLSDVAERLGC
jgi:putative hydrolase of the HAD superfamily